MADTLEPLSTNPDDFVFIDVETRSTEDVKPLALGGLSERRVTPSDLHTLLDVCFYTGRLKWRKRYEGMQAAGKTLSRHGANIFNGKFLHTSVGSVGPNGYLQIGFLGYDLLAHRVIWTMRFGAWPDRKVDHINGDRLDNRLVNLRLVDDTDHTRNMARPRHNTSGHVGVRKTSSGRWQAYICVADRQRHIGVYSSFGEAVAARKAAERANSFHENHGRDPHVRS